MSIQFIFTLLLAGGLVLLTAVVMALLLWGSAGMYRLSSYRLAIATVVLAMLPLHPACVVGIPIGIWALIVLTNPAVKAAFAEARSGGAGKLPA